MQRETKASEVQILAQLATGIASGRIRVVDLTVPLEPTTPTNRLPPQFAPPKSFGLQEISRYDAPVHWVTGKDHPNSATHDIPVDRFIGTACVIDVSEQVAGNADFLLTR